MYDRMIPAIKPGSKLVIGLGDSFTQGVGSWPADVWAQYNGNIDTLKIPDTIYDQMYDNAWVKQLCDNYLPDYTPINLGCLGTGNRSAVKNLYLHPGLKLENAAEVIVVYMLTGMERFDFINQTLPEHNHFFTMWPNPWDKNTTNKKLWEAYAESIWSEIFVCTETLLNIKEAEIICKANGWKLVITSAFDTRITKEHFIKELGEHRTDLVNSIPWDKFLYPENKKSFMELLLHLEGKPELAVGGFYDYCKNLKMPTQFITPCAHPSQNGHTIIANYIYKHLVSKGIV